MSLFHLVYVSSAVSPFSTKDLIRLLERSRARNESAAISGLLLYHDGNFMQLLEGEESVVLEVHARISRDPRHRGLITLMKGPIEARTFSEWSMGFRNLDSIEVQKTPGYSAFLNVDWRSREMLANPTRAFSLLKIFRDSLRYAGR